MRKLLILFFTALYFYFNDVQPQDKFECRRITFDIEQNGFPSWLPDSKYILYQITQNEIPILKYLIDKKGEIVSRKELLENVLNISPEIETRTVDIFISHIRKYIEHNLSNPKYIKSVRNIDYIYDE